MEASRHHQCRGWVGFNVSLAHRITAGADMLLMPSRFEPCGLNQLYAMAYGTVPIVHAVSPVPALLALCAFQAGKNAAAAGFPCWILRPQLDHGIPACPKLCVSVDS